MYNLYSVYILYSANIMYSVYIVYHAYFVYSVYILCSAYIAYSVYFVYSAYIVYSVYVSNCTIYYKKQQLLELTLRLVPANCIEIWNNTIFAPCVKSAKVLCCCFEKEVFSTFSSASLESISIKHRHNFSLFIILFVITLRAK